MIRKIIQINEDKCNGCQLCVNACHEGAIAMVNGKAKLISDEYCDGLGDCLPACPVDAIKIVQREADEYDEELVIAKQKEREAVKEEKPHVHSEGCPGSASRVFNREEEKPHVHSGGCPGSATRTFNREEEKPHVHSGGCPGSASRTFNREEEKPHTHSGGCPGSASQTFNIEDDDSKGKNIPSMLNQWPIQLRLVNPKAGFLENSNLLIAADCTAFAYGNFHSDFIKNHVVIIACPKLDELDTEKLAEIIKTNNIKSIKTVKMEVPCCTGLQRATEMAIANSGKNLELETVTISLDGNIM